MTTETVQNFNITDWVDEFFSFTGNSKLSTDFPANEIELSAFCHEDVLGQVDEAQISEFFAYKIAKKRAEGVGLKCSVGFLTLVATCSESPGAVVMWIQAMRHQQDAEHLKGVVGNAVYHADDFLRIVGHKMPTKAHLHKMWDAQKGKQGQKVDNWLDVIWQEEKFVQATRDGYVKLES